MHTVETCSRRFDFLRLHHWAWTRQVIRKPYRIQPERESYHIIRLLRQLIQKSMREAWVDCHIDVNRDQEQLSVTFVQPLQILKSLANMKTLPGNLRWEESNSLKSRTMLIPLRKDSIWCASQQLQALETFLHAETKSTTHTPSI